MGELNLADIRSPEDLEGAVLKLHELHRLELNPTERITDEFVIAKNRVFFESQYGNIVVYTIPDQRKIAEFHFEPNSIKDMATDGERIYLQLMGHATAKEDDVVIAMLENIADAKSPLKFVGKRIKDITLSNRLSAQADAGWMETRIVSFHVSTVLTDAIIDNPYSLFHQSTRFFIPGIRFFAVDMFSKDGYVDCGFGSPELEESDCSGTFYLKDGELYSPDSSVLETRRQSLPERVLVTTMDRLDLRAEYLWNPEKPDPAPTPLPIVFKGSGEGRPLPHAFILRENRWFDGYLYVLWDHRARDNGPVTKVDAPHILIRYKVAIEKE